jgi:hypothetical protein
MPQDNQSSGQDLNRGPPEYKSRALLADNLSTVVLCGLEEVYCHSGGLCCLLDTCLTL